MRLNRLKRNLAQDRVGIGLILLSPDPHLTAVAGEAGFDYVMPDLEHAALSLRELEGLVAAAHLAGMECVARVPGAQKRDILAVLDTGVDGIMVPAVESPEEAAGVVAAARYHPEGRRGVYYQSPVSRYGSVPPREHMAEANRELLIIAQIETAAGLEQAEAIAAVPGIDCLLVGPGDLSQSLGVPWEFGHRDVTQAIERTFRVAREQGKIAGIMPAGLEHAAECCTLGARLLIWGPDIGIYRRAAEEDVARLRRVLPWGA